MFGEKHVLWWITGDVLHDDHAIAQAERRLHRVGQTRAVSFAGGTHHQPVNDYLDSVHLVAIQLDLFVHLAHDPIHPHPDKARFANFVKHGLVVALAVLHQRSHDQNVRPVRQALNVVHDLLRRLAGDLAATMGTMRDANAGVEQAQVVVNLCHRAHCRAGVVAAPPLINRDGRAEALDLIHVRLVHLAQELPRVGGQGFDVAALAFGVEGIKGQAALARAGNPRDDDQLVAGDLDGDVLQVMLARAAHNDLVLRHGCLSRCWVVGWSGILA